MSPTGDATHSKIAIGADHAGFERKNRIRDRLREEGYEVLDVGTNGTESVDYPDFAAEVASRVSRRDPARGILICGTGIGMSITANRFLGVRAAVVATPFMAEMAAAHNDANVLCLGSRVLDDDSAYKLVKIWLTTKFEGGRHARRVEKIGKMPVEPRKDPGRRTTK